MNLRSTFKQCMAEALQPVVQRKIVRPAQRFRRHMQPGGNFGDDKLKPKSATPRVLLRFFLVLPLGALGVGLCASVIGIPLGVPLLLWVGAFISKPIRQLPAFNINATTVTEEEDGD